MTSPPAPEARPLAELAARIEAAEAGSRELDCDVFVATAESPFVNYYPDCVLAVLGGFRARVEIADIKPYTTSLDAALALVSEKLPGWGWEVDFVAGDEPPYTAMFWRPDGGPMTRQDGHTPALALCAALLRALAEGQET